MIPRCREIGLAPAGDVAKTFFVDGFGQHRSGGGSVAGHIGSLRGNLFDELGSHILVGIVQFNFLGDGHTVLGDRRAPEFLFEDHVAPGRSERGLDGRGEFGDTSEQRFARGFVELQLLSHFVFRYWIVLELRSAERNSGENSEDIVFVEDEVLFAIQLHFGTAVLADENLVALLTVKVRSLPSSILADPDGDHEGLLRLFLVSVWDDDPALGLSSASVMRLTRTRCPRGDVCCHMWC